MAMRALGLALVCGGCTGSRSGETGGPPAESTLVDAGTACVDQPYGASLPPRITVDFVCSCDWDVADSSCAAAWEGTALVVHASVDLVEAPPTPGTCSCGWVAVSCLAPSAEDGSYTLEYSGRSAPFALPLSAEVCAGAGDS